MRLFEGFIGDPEDSLGIMSIGGDGSAMAEY